MEPVFSSQEHSIPRPDWEMSRPRASAEYVLPSPPLHVKEYCPPLGFLGSDLASGMSAPSETRPVPACSARIAASSSNNDLERVILKGSQALAASCYPLASDALAIYLTTVPNPYQ